MNKVKFITNSLLFSTLFLFLASPGFAVRKGVMPAKPTVTTGTQKSCVAREASVKKRMTQLSQLVSTQYRVFDRTATRVQEYYTNTVLPSGKSLSNYAALVNDIAAKKALVDTEVTKEKNSISAFNCASGDPKTHMNNFRVNMQSVKTALKDYRTSVKNLIVAVRSLGGDEDATATTTPTPSI